ncbi:MAG: Fe-S cluster assembly protein SufD [bacterium]
MPHRAIQNLEFIDFALSQFQIFENNLDGQTAHPFHNTRQAAMRAFAELGIPTTRHEEWKYTNVLPIFKNKLVYPQQHVRLHKDQVRKFAFDGMADNMIVLLNGRFSQELSTIPFATNGIKIESLANTLVTKNGDVEKYLSKYASFENEPFVALNTAFATDGTLIHISENIVLEKPVHLCHISVSEEGTSLIHPRTLIIAGKNSQAHIIESFHALSEKPYFTNAVSEIVLGENATLEHIKVQQENRAAFHIASSTILQASSSRYTSANVDLGGAIVRNNLNVVLDGEGCEAHLYGFFMGTGTQLIDNHTMIDHARPHCESNELYKGILDEKSKGVFNGKVMVRPDAQKTNAFQENKCLLLTDDAVMNAKPQLEIFADDVKCSHGATVGQLDDDALFYLRARGIGEEKANAILRHAFASDVFNHIEVDAVKNKLEAIIFEHFGD